MDYICYVHTTGHDVPFMDIVAGESPDDAIRHCRKLLRERPDSHTAEVYSGDKLIRRLKWRAGSSRA